VERWADECAATQTGDRSLAARAVARAALATSAAPPDRDAAMTALGMITLDVEARRTGSLRGAGPVPRRVAALLAPPPRPLLPPRPSQRSLLLLGAAIFLVALSAASTLDAAASLHGLIELAQGQTG